VRSRTCNADFGGDPARTHRAPRLQGARSQPRDLRHQDCLTDADASVCRTVLHCHSARGDLEVGEEGFAADVDEQADSAGDGCGLGFVQCQGFGSIDGRGQPGVVDVERERDPFVGADVCARLVVPRVLLAQPVELPVGVGEVLDGALVTRAGRVRFRPFRGRR
jgi:hypothetical protein